MRVQDILTIVEDVPGLPKARTYKVSDERFGFKPQETASKIFESNVEIELQGSV